MLARFSCPNLRADDEPDPASLWSGHSLDGWMTLDKQPAPPGWVAKDGVIHLLKTPERTGHIVTRSEFGDFELEFEWRIAPGGNSGIKYRVRTYGERTIGCEYQIYDPNGKEVDPKNQTAALYDLYEPSPEAVVHPAGSWNHAKIRVCDQHIEHWLNGRLAVNATVGDSEWERRIAESKFNEAENFSKNRFGRLMLTDHGSEVWYRNMRFQSLESQ
jgi:hypothetical protein